MSQNHAAELERQELIKRCHSLVAAIANRPGSIKLLLGIVPTLEIFAGYKSNRRSRHNVKGRASLIKDKDLRSHRTNG